MTGGPRDARAAALGAVAWLAVLAALHVSIWVSTAVGVMAAGWLWWRWRRDCAVLTHATWLATALGVLALTLVRAEGVQRSPLAGLAQEHAVVEVRMVTTSDPVLRQGGVNDYVVVRGRVETVVGRSVRHHVRAPVLLVANPRWRDVPLGSSVLARGRLQPARTQDLAAVLSPRGPPKVVSRPGPLLDGAAALRRAIRGAVSQHDAGPRALVPALVDGDDAGMPTDLVDAFRAAGLTHLLAVSGTNLTLVVGSLLLLARWCGVRARGLMFIGLVGVAGFVLLARTEPSVLRAAVMGSVALIGMGTNGRARGSRALGAAVLILLLLDPWLAESPGFALSALATAGIIWLAPGWRDRLQRWLPRWVAEAVSVPLAAQLACTPLVAALSGQVSLVAVFANLVAAPLVGPATVLGLAGGVAGLVWMPLGQLVAAPAAWCASGIIAVAEHASSLPVATIGWSARPVGVALLTLVCAALALACGVVLARPVTAIGLGLVMVAAVLVPVPSPGWPPRDWVMVACDVGQGDGLVLRVSEQASVVVDTGPDPGPMNACLRRLGVEQIPLLVLTHFHADHVGGLTGAVHRRRVGSIVVSPLTDPNEGARRVAAVAARIGVDTRVATYGETGSLGPLRWQVLAPSRTPSSSSQSPPNDASVVLLVETRGVRLLLMGDQEESSQAQLRRDTGGALRADVLKVAHHGSARQDAALLSGLGARLAVLSMAAENDYGHPAPTTVALLRESRMHVARTDRAGDVAVVVEEGGGLQVVTRR